MAPRHDTAAQRKALGEAIWKRRNELSLSQEEVAERAGVDRTYISGLELGQRNPTFETILRVARALDKRPSKLLAAAEKSPGTAW